MTCEKWEMDHYKQKRLQNHTADKHHRYMSPTELLFEWCPLLAEICLSASDKLFMMSVHQINVLLWKTQCLFVLFLKVNQQQSWKNMVHYPLNLSIRGRHDKEKIQDSMRQLLRRYMCHYHALSIQRPLNYPDVLICSWWFHWCWT